MIRAAASFGLLLVAGCGVPSPPALNATRVISIDYCADQMVLGLVSSQHIAAVSRDVEADPLFSRPLARGLPRTDANVERLIALRPSLVVRSYAGSPRFDAVLARAGIPVFTLPFADTLDAVRQSVRASGAALNARARAEERLAEMDRQLATAQRLGARSRDALYTTPGSYTSGNGTLIDELLRSAHLRNVEERAGWHRLNIEALVTRPPDIIVRAFGESQRHQTDRWSSQSHAALAEVMRHRPTIEVPGSMVACGNWRIGEAVEMLSAGNTEGMTP